MEELKGFTSEELEGLKTRALGLAVHAEPASSEFHNLIGLAEAVSVLEYYARKEESRRQQQQGG